MRLAKDIRLRSIGVRPQFDLYNLLNGNVPILQNNTYGSSWQVPTAVLGGRLAKFSAQVTF